MPRSDRGGSLSALQLAEGIELGYALVARVAEDIGARVLAIKGLVNEAHELRSPRPSADVDVLVEPERLKDLVDALTSAGWRRAPTAVLPSPFGDHSVTLNHPQWPCEIDVHDRFPGFFAEPDVVFDALWTDHTYIAAAGIDVPATDLYGTVLIMALHALRTPSDPRNAHELVGLIKRLSLRSFDRDRLRRLASATGCLATARPFLRALAIYVPYVDPNDPRIVTWELRRSVQGTRNLSWLKAIRHTPARRWPALLLKVALSNEPTLRQYYPQAPPGRRGLWLARWWRLKLAIRDLPEAIRVARRIDASRH